MECSHTHLNTGSPTHTILILRLWQQRLQCALFYFKLPTFFNKILVFLIYSCFFIQFYTVFKPSQVVLCFLIHKSYVRSIKRYCFVHKYAAIPVQLEIFILQYIGWCVLIIWTFIVNKFGCFCQFLMDNFG